MHEEIEIDYIINNKNYSKIYNPFYIIILLILIFIYIINVYEYESYLIYEGTWINNNLEILVPITDIDTINKYHILSINDIDYNYHISKIKDNTNNTKYLYLEISNLVNIDNYPNEIKIATEKKKIITYLKEYL